MPTTKEILDKYSKKLESEIETAPESKDYSEEYQKFKQEMAPNLSPYEKLCNSLGNFINLKISEKDKIKIEGELKTAHLEVTPSQAVALSIFSFIAVFLLTIVIAVSIYFINGSKPILFAFLGLLAGLFVLYYTYTTPKRIANSWKLEASSQMVPAILYVVIYMKHTSNLERAIAFASEHLEGPLALDFKKIFYDVEIGKFSTIKQSLDNYLETWRDYAPEFIESFHLVESSLYETSEANRNQILEKSLQVILDGVYEKMLKYSREIRTPLTNVYMLGIILPTLALAILPLASTLLGGLIQWYHIFLLFNVIVPFLVFYLISEALLKHPGGYGQSEILELNPDYEKYKSKKPWAVAALIAAPLLILGLLPFIFLLFGSISFPDTFTFATLKIPFLQSTKIFDFQCVGDALSATCAGGNVTGPFSAIAVILSLFIPLSIALFFSIAYKAKTSELIKARENTKLLETEFTNTLFQLGNRIGDGTPAEIAFGRVAESTQGQKTHDFFSMVNQNITQAGMSLERAIFDKKRGALIYYPSALIATSMRILLESVKKGLQVAAHSLMSISEYVKNIEKINQRLRDLLAEIV